MELILGVRTMSFCLLYKMPSGNTRLWSFRLSSREGWKDNHKRTHRVYKEEGLNLRSKRPRRNKMAAHRMERPGTTGLYECCSMDFVSDALFDGRKFRALTLVDNFSRECLAIYVGQSLRGSDYFLNSLAEFRMNVNSEIT
jgi:putative transposase